jgi:phosphoglycolate phosphatase-like HAD superfamily hydrolase
MTDRSNIQGNKPLNKPYTLAAIDYDGVLIDEKVSRKINKEAYERAILESERKGATFPRELKKYSYLNLVRVKREYPEIFLDYLYNVGNIIASDESIKKEKERIDAILKFVDKRLKADEKVVVTANFAAEITLKSLGYHDMKVIIVDGENYISAKSEAIIKLREEKKREKGDVDTVYIGDTDEDMYISEKSGTKFVHIERILYEIWQNSNSFDNEGDK